MAVKNELSQSSSDRKYIMFAARIVGDFGGTIAIPVVVFVLIGQWVDRKYDSSPWCTILAFVLAALLSGRMIYKKAKVYGKEYQKIGEENSRVKNTNNHVSENDKK